MPSRVGGDTEDDAATMLKAQVAVLESTNSLLINASESQHKRMANLIEHVDVETCKEAIPYEIYFLENCTRWHFGRKKNPLKKPRRHRLHHQHLHLRRLYPLPRLSARASR